MCRRSGFLAKKSIGHIQDMYTNWGTKIDFMIFFIFHILLKPL